jgi:outer membrane immunogenic protein
LGRIDRSDWRGGAHLGWLTQQGPWVWGIEGDVDTGRSALTLAGAGTADLGASATLRAKAGIALGDWLPYVTAGIAVARPAVTPLGGLTNHDWRLGHALGAGLAWRFSPNLSLRGEVLHVGFGDVDTGVGKVRLDETRVRAGVTWHFN